MFKTASFCFRYCQFPLSHQGPNKEGPTILISAPYLYQYVRYLGKLKRSASNLLRYKICVLLQPSYSVSNHMYTSDNLISHLKYFTSPFGCYRCPLRHLSRDIFQFAKATVPEGSQDTLYTGLP